ncbi:glycosyltransferase family 1 protein [Cytophagales bacterium RKSG123]|nr:glycosyltransferase family 1 protein [Xanthovirga aplysinae]
MKIAFDAKRAFTNFTGLGNYSRFMIKALSDFYPENQYLLYSPRTSDHKEVTDLLLQKNVKVRIPSRFVSKLKLHSIWRSYMLGNIAVRDRADILHGLSNELPLLNNCRLKTVVTIHDLLFIRYPELYNRLDVIIYKKKARHACKVADRIIAISQQTADDLQEFLGVDPSKIDIVYQGCLPQFKCEEESTGLRMVSDKYNLPEDFLLNVGTIEARKNALLILKALAIHKHHLDIPLVIVGKATKYKNELVAYAEKEGIADRIIFLHQVNFEDLPKIYQLAKVFIYPSIFEGFGIPIIEAINSSVPVITSKGSCFSEAGGPDCLYVDPSNAEELAEAILLILTNSKLANQMRNKSLDYVKRFEEEKIAADLMEVYKKVM